MHHRPRPVFLNLFQIHFPITAITSIAHRVSGVFLFLCMPCMLWLWKVVLGSAADYQRILDCLAEPYARVAVWLMLSSFGFHLLAGLRHVFMDISWLSCEKKTANISAYGLWLLAIVWFVLLGMRLW
jgi:succinate dehydrogenase / fumarate reductase, cytochrome b subunit